MSDPYRGASECDQGELVVKVRYLWRLVEMDIRRGMYQPYGRSRMAFMIPTEKRRGNSDG